MGMRNTPLVCDPPLSASQIADLRLAASKMTGPTRRAFQAEMTLKYCQGKPLQGETVFGWGRHTVALGLSERRTGIICLGAQAAFSGRKRWEDQHPAVAATLRQLADAHAQQDPTFRTTLDMDWGFGANNQLTAPSIQLGNFGLDASSFLHGFLGDIVKTAQKFTKPIQPFIDVF